MSGAPASAAGRERRPEPWLPGEETLAGWVRQLPRRTVVSHGVYVWLYKLTPFGRVLLLVLFASGTIGGALGIDYPMYLLATFVVAILLVSEVVGLGLRPRARVERTLPMRCAAGAPVRVRARLENVGRRPIFDVAVRETASPPALRLAIEHEYLEHLPAGAAAELTYVVEPTRRGAYDLPGPELLTAYPFGVYHTTRLVKAPHRMLVYPRFQPIAHLRLPVGARYQPGGVQLVSQVGDSEEYVGSREYRPGDRIRDLHHSAWARLGFPVVREFQQEYLARVALVLDTYLPGLAQYTQRGRRRFEAAVSLAAAVADALSGEDYVVDLFAAGPELFHFQAGRSLAYLDDILDVLACIDPCTRSPFPTLTPALLDAIGLVSSAVLVLVDWDEERRGLVSRLEERGVTVKVALVAWERDRERLRAAASSWGPATLLTPEQVAAGVDEL